MQDVVRQLAQQPGPLVAEMPEGRRNLNSEIRLRPMPTKSNRLSGIVL
jgi:hypothetical protein